MAKACYVGVNSKARKVKKIYAGVSNVARKVKKGYVGVGGVARPFFSADQKLAYYGQVLSMETVREHHAAISIDNYVIFAGGYVKLNTVTSSCEAFTKSFVKVSISELDFSGAAVGASLGGKAIIGAKYNISLDDDDDDTQGKYFVYTANLVKTTIHATKYMQKESACTVNNTCIFTPFLTSSSTSGYYIECVDSNFVISSVSLSCFIGNYGGSTAIGDYVLFGGGGFRDGNVSSVLAITKSLAQTKIDSLQAGGYGSAATSTEDYAIFTGGGYKEYSWESEDTVDAYTASLTKQTLANLPVSTLGLGATSLGGYAIFANATLSVSYTNDLVCTQYNKLSKVSSYNSACTFGDYALFSGGSWDYTAKPDSNTLTNAVEAFALV